MACPLMIANLPGAGENFAFVWKDGTATDKGDYNIDTYIVKRCFVSEGLPEPF